MIEKKERNSNIELYRIIVMLLIVMHHYVVNSGLLDEMFKTPLAPESIFLYLFGMWGKTGIDCFVLITGYFMCKSSISLYKFVKLLLQIELYNVLFYCIFLYTGYMTLSFSNIIQVINPIPSVNTGFTSCFLLFYLFIPYLYILLNNLSKSKHILLVFYMLLLHILDFMEFGVVRIKCSGGGVSRLNYNLRFKRAYDAFLGYQFRCEVGLEFGHVFCE